MIIQITILEFKLMESPSCKFIYNILEFYRKNKVRGHFRDLEKIWKQVRERKAGNVSEGENVIRQTER